MNPMALDYDDYMDEIPELEDHEKAVILELYIDPDWKERWHDPAIAWDFYYEGMSDDMDQHAIEHKRECATDKQAELMEALEDIGTPFMLKRQAD